ncbi:MAG: hypothetical protein IPK19_28555 [Chloroflexi bacterium]|nr:hypothetical protein [Chloroflexota bacterium]
MKRLALALLVIGFVLLLMNSRGIGFSGWWFFIFLFPIFMGAGVRNRRRWDEPRQSWDERETYDGKRKNDDAPMVIEGQKVKRTEYVLGDDGELIEVPVGDATVDGPRLEMPEGNAEPEMDHADHDAYPYDARSERENRINRRRDADGPSEYV